MQKLYYSISEVSELLKEEQHILRYWEKEFKSLKPKKNSAGNRKYNKKDLDLLKRIKQLIREDKITLTAAKDVIDNNKPFVQLNQESLFAKPKLPKMSKDELLKVIDVLKEFSSILKK